MSTRTVTYTITRPVTGVPWPNAQLSWQLIPGSFDEVANYPNFRANSTTDENGEGSVELWANEEGSIESVYRVSLPSGETADFTLPAGDDPIDLTVLRALGVINQDWSEELLTAALSDPEALGLMSEEDGEALWAAIDDIGPGLPPGGTTGQHLAKMSDDDFDADWMPPGTPGAHASSHADGGIDEVTIATSQVTGLQTALDAKAAAADLTAHINDTTAAHAASAIAFTPAAGIAADDVQEAIEEVAGDVTTHAALTAAHGATGAVVGTTNTQTLTNKTLTDAVLNGEITGTAGIRKIRETGGPTVLTLGAVADGEFLKRDGSTIIGGAPAGGGDMLVATYDPQAIGDDAFDRANHTGAQAISTVTGLQTALDAKALASDLSAHLSDATDAHDASAISFVPAGTIAATEAQAAIEEVATDAASALSTHTGNTSNPHSVTKTQVGLGNVTNDAQAKADFSGYTAKATPVDADTVIINDSADSGAVKKVTWANIKATLLTWLNGLALQLASIELGHASDTSLTRVSAGVVAVEGKNVALNGTGEVLTTGSIELGAASDTTLSRSSAGVIAVEGVTVPLNSMTNVHTAQQIELGHASDTSITRVSAGVAAVEGKNIALNGTGEALTTGSVELGHASDTTLTRSSAGVLAVEGVVVPTISSSNTLTNKRTQPRTSTAASGDITPALATENIYQRTALSAGITINAPTGTPVLGEVVVLMLKDNGTTRALTWNATYKAVGAALPTTTTVNKRHLITAQYDGTDWLALSAIEV
jgi:hypothetical protein